MDGIILVNKDKDYTSRDVVNKVGRILGTKKVGHTGTLDPMATGVLAICVGKATKLVDMITCDEKEYIAGVKLGILTDTLDVTGTIIDRYNKIVSKEEIISVLESMVGFYEQEVPIYSAVKVNGRKLYDYARCGISVDLPKRMVNIKEIELISDVVNDDGVINFTIRCLVSKGTYIRSLVRDIAYRLGTVGVMSMLCRTKQGCFKLADTYSLNQIENGNFEMISIRDYLSDMFTIKVDDNFRCDILNGKVLKNVHNRDILFVDGCDMVLAIYRVDENDSSKIKPYKMFGGVK